MRLVRRLMVQIAWGILCLGLPVLAWAQANTDTATRTATNTRTLTETHTPTNTLTVTRTPTESWTPTPSPTPNLTLTPPCGAGIVFGNKTGAANGLSTNTMRASMFPLNVPATVYSIWLQSQDSGDQVVVGIYNGAVSQIGTLAVSSSVQTATEGWNAFPITPTYLPAGNYWLGYSYDAASFSPLSTAAANPNELAYTSTAFAFGTMPNPMPNPVYDAPSTTGTPASYTEDAIYAVYCDAPTNTPTYSQTPTATNSPTITHTPSNTATLTETGTILTNTPTSSFTMTPTQTWTFTLTFTSSYTPNPSLTPDCGAAASIFGNSVTIPSGGPVTANDYEFRACLYNLPVTGNVETISLYCPTANLVGGVTAVVGIYTSQTLGTTQVIGDLIAQPDIPSPQAMVAGWNTYNIPATILPPGNYWLAYLYSAGTSFIIDYQTSSPTTNSLALATTNISSWALDPVAATYVPTYNVGESIHDPIFASYCGLVLSPTLTNTPTFSPSQTSTDTSTPTSTSTPTLSATYSPTVTATFSTTSTATETPSYSPTETPTLTDTPSITNTPTITPTFTPSGTPTDTATITLTFSPTPTATLSQTPTITNTPTLTPTSTSTGTPTDTDTITMTYSPTDTPTLTDTPTISDTPTLTSTSTDTGTPTDTATLSPTLSPTDTATITSTDSPTLSPTPTATNSSTSTATLSETFTATGTSTDSPTLTATLSATNSPNLTWTNTNTSTSTATSSPTDSPSSTATPSATLTASSSPTLTPTNSCSLTPTSTSALTATSTATFTPTQSVPSTPILYPNPLKGNGPVTLAVNFDKPHDYVTLKVFTIAFRKVYERTVNYVPAGPFGVSLKPGDFTGGSAANGLYYVQITTPTNHWILKLLILK